MKFQSSGGSTPTQEDAIEAKAFVDLYRISSEKFRQEEQFECLPINEGCAISLPSAPAIGLNRILGLCSIEDLEEAYGWFQQKAGNRFLQLNMDAASDAMKLWVQSKALSEHGPGWAKLSCKASLSTPDLACNVPTRRVRPKEASLFGSIMCGGFNFPPQLLPLWAGIVGKTGWSCFFALDGETPIGTAAMYVSGTHAWLGGGTTLPGFRNRGVQKALIQARTEHGIAHSVSTFIVETEAPSIGKPNISYENLKKMGFQFAYNRKNFRL